MAEKTKKLTKKQDSELGAPYVYNRIHAVDRGVVSPRYKAGEADKKVDRGVVSPRYKAGEADKKNVATDKYYAIGGRGATGEKKTRKGILKPPTP